VVPPPFFAGIVVTFPSVDILLPSTVLVALSHSLSSSPHPVAHFPSFSVVRHRLFLFLSVVLPAHPRSSTKQMSTEMQVARLVEVGEPLEVGTASKPTITNPRDVLVKVVAAGLVPNSKNVINGAMDNNGFPLQELPAIFGLDAAGVVEEVGENVLNIKKGDRVYVNPLLSDGTCHQCRRGRPDLCTAACLRGYFGMGEASKKTLATYPIGSLSQYLLSPDSKVVILPPTISTLTAARFGYAGTSYGALKKVGFFPGQTLLINGVTGTLGVAAVALALGMGATKILGIGRNKERLERVEQLAPKKDGFPSRVAVRSSEDEGSIADWVLEQTGGVGVDVIYDCLGVGGDAKTTAELFSKAVRAGGQVVLAAGGAEGDISQSYAQYQARDVRIHGSQWFRCAFSSLFLSALSFHSFSLSNFRSPH
jgi:threonine dehydrogenase-like Zn-dependent dehydrogenase